MNKTTISNEFPYAGKFIRELPSVFDSSGKLLYDGRNRVKSFTVGDTVMVVKRYKRPNIIQSISYTFFRKSKALRAYLFAGMLRERGFDTPREVACIEIGRGILMSDSYFVSASCTLPALSELLRVEDFDRGAACDLAAFLVRLHAGGVLHGDLNLTNILYDKQPDGHYKFTLIDTNRSKFRQTTHSDCIENLKRLTHDEALMTYVVRQYALIRGWNQDDTVREVMNKVRDFEKRRRWTGRVKKIMRRLKNVYSTL